MAPPAAAPAAALPSPAADGPSAKEAAPPALRGDTPPAEPTTPPPPATEPVAAPAADPPPMPKNTAVLHIGDSFVLAGFAQALKPKMKELGVRYAVKSEQSSYTTTWASRLELVIANTQPDLVIITLGANEVANVDPPAHAHAVKRIARLSAGLRFDEPLTTPPRRPCVWVLPPLWRKDTGIMNVIREHSVPCRLFDTDKIITHAITRKPDKIHPNEVGGATWAEGFWAWLQEQREPERGAWALRPAAADEHAPRAFSPRNDAVVATR